MFIEIENYFCINITKINYFKQFWDNGEGQLCIIYTNEFPNGMKFKDKNGKLYYNLKKIFNACDALALDPILDEDGKVKW